MDLAETCNIQKQPENFCFLKLNHNIIRQDQRTIQNFLQQIHLLLRINVTMNINSLSGKVEKNHPLPSSPAGPSGPGSPWSPSGPASPGSPSIP